MKKLKKLKVSIIFALLYINLYSQETKIIDGEKFCSRNLLTIIKDDDRIQFWIFPEELIQNINTIKIDSSSSIIKEKIKTNYLLDNGWDLELSSSVNGTDFFYLISLKKGKKIKKQLFFFKENVHIDLIGVKFNKKENKFPKLYFSSNFGGYSQPFSFSFEELKFVTQPPGYIPCQ